MNVAPRADLALLAHVVARPDADIDLGQAALLIAESEYPSLDIDRYLRELDAIAAEAREQLGSARMAPHAGSVGRRGEALERALRFLYESLGFRGNAADYYDPRNSYLNDVIDRRTGIPITLAVVLIEVCQRIGIDARGVSFPGHFLVRAGDAGSRVFVDPFEGCILEPSALRSLYSRATGKSEDPDPRLLEPASKRHILGRMLNNLGAIYASASDGARLTRVLEHLYVVAPSQEVKEKLEQLGGHVLRPVGRGDTN